MINLTSGKSEKDRITFYSKNFMATAIRDENNEIKTKFNKKDDNILNGVLFLLGIFGGLSVIKSFIIIPLIKKEILGSIWYLFPVFVYLFFMIVSIIYINSTGGKKMLKNHGAEHKVYFAYKRLKRVPSIEKAKKYSRFNSSCGVSIYSAFITTQLIGFWAYFYAGFKIPELILFLIPLFFSNFVPFSLLGLFAQLFTTHQPDDENIELAIAALESLEKNSYYFDKLLNSLIGKII